MMAGFMSIAAMLKAKSGLIVGREKLYLLETRLGPMMKREGIADLAALARLLQPGCALEREVVETMTTNESSFFRDGKPFEALRTRILPRLHAGRPAGCPLRIWSAAASTGQEAYSIAMIAADLAPLLAGRPVEILATDIAREPLERARAGVFTQFEMQRGLPMTMLVKHFIKEEAAWRVKPALREAVTFREWNLLDDVRPLGRFDVIFCRNVLIYFDTPTKQAVLDSLARQLAPDGVLILGGAETVLGLTDTLRPVTGETGFYLPASAMQNVA